MRLEKLTGVKYTPVETEPDDSFVLPFCRMGIELELEGLPNRRNFAGMTYWDVKEDGSLRDNGSEFVLRNPEFGKRLKESIDELHQTIVDKARPKVSERTSLHVHMDVRDVENTESILSFLALYLTFERTIFRYFNDEREGNVFCMPLYRTQHTIPGMAYMLTAKQDEEYMAPELQKYNALNLRSMFRFGSIEFRHAPATWDKASIIEWINIIQSLKKAALAGANPIEALPETMSLQGPDGFLFSVFGQELGNKLMNAEIQQDMYDGIRLCQDLIYCRRMTEHLTGKQMYNPKGSWLSRKEDRSQSLNNLFNLLQSEG